MLLVVRPRVNFSIHYNLTLLTIQPPGGFDLKSAEDKDEHSSASKDSLWKRDVAAAGVSHVSRFERSHNEKSISSSLMIDLIPSQLRTKPRISLQLVEEKCQVVGESRQAE